MSRRDEILSAVETLHQAVGRELETLQRNYANPNGRWNLAASRRLRVALGDLAKQVPSLRRQLREADQS